jgi:hypothetical protein
MSNGLQSFNIDAAFSESCSFTMLLRNLFKNEILFKIDKCNIPCHHHHHNQDINVFHTAKVHADPP